MRSAIKRISKIIGGRERWVFMEIIVSDGVSIKIEDEKIVSLSYDEILNVRLKNDSKLIYLPFARNIFLTDD